MLNPNTFVERIEHESTRILKRRFIDLGKIH